MFNCEVYIIFPLSTEILLLFLCEYVTADRVKVVYDYSGIELRLCGINQVIRHNNYRHNIVRWVYTSLQSRLALVVCAIEENGMTDNMFDFSYILLLNMI